MEPEDPNIGNKAEEVRFNVKMIHTTMLGETYTLDPKIIPKIGTVTVCLMGPGPLNRKKDDALAFIINPDGSISETTCGEAKNKRYLSLAMLFSEPAIKDATLTIKLKVDKSNDNLLCSTDGHKDEDGRVNFVNIDWRSSKTPEKRDTLYLNNPGQLKQIEFGFMLMPHRGGDVKT